MWDDVVIGKSKVNYQVCSAIKVFDISVDNISENFESYWISNCILDTGMKVFKDTPEGEKIGKLIENKAYPAQIQNYLDKLVLANLSVTRLRHYIKAEKKKSFEAGERAKLSEIQNVLGISGRGGYLV